ncbi:MAG TPA: hypothetical protein PLR08_02580 [bacterium]|nr:hypothetical protein [Candidatus Magasanikbacteria bacterium]USN52681.1 MAG: hypothetical protein H6759_01225 [Candidatus Nomurabacteria bacterium]HPF95408.1 hypothetical protein [bacterium]
MNFITPLFSLSFWFSYYATPFSPWVSKLILILLAVLALSSILLLLWKRQLKDIVKRHAASRLATCGITSVIVGLLLWLMTYENIPFLSARIFWLLWLGIFGTWKVMIFRRYQKEQRDARMTHDPERAAYEKYLPKPKGRK